MEALRKHIYDLLLVNGLNVDRIFFEEIPRDKAGIVDLGKQGYPVLVYHITDFIQSSSNKVRLDIPITLDIWYTPNTELTIYNLVDRIDKRLDNNHASLYNGRGQDGSVNPQSIISIKRSSNYMSRVPDSNPNIKRIQLGYNITYYK